MKHFFSSMVLIYEIVKIFILFISLSNHEFLFPEILATLMLLIRLDSTFLAFLNLNALEECFLV